jgi:DNA-binding transcriptional MerR regulator
MTRRRHRAETEDVVSYTMAQLVAEAGVTVRTVRHWVHERVLPHRDYGDWFFKYDEAFRARLLAVVRLRDKGWHLPEIREKLDRATPEEITALAGLAPPAGARRALYERWERISLHAGLELHLRTDAPAEAVQLARWIETQIGRR